jgi:hypothetical protein
MENMLGNIVGILLIVLIFFFVRLIFIRFDKIFKNTERMEDLERQNNEILDELIKLRSQLEKKN